MKYVMDIVFFALIVKHNIAAKLHHIAIFMQAMTACIKIKFVKLDIRIILG